MPPDCARSVGGPSCHILSVRYKDCIHYLLATALLLLAISNSIEEHISKSKSWAEKTLKLNYSTIKILCAYISLLRTYGSLKPVHLLSL